MLSNPFERSIFFLYHITWKKCVAALLRWFMWAQSNPGLLHNMVFQPFGLDLTVRKCEWFEWILHIFSFHSVVICYRFFPNPNVRKAYWLRQTLCNSRFNNWLWSLTFLTWSTFIDCHYFSSLWVLEKWELWCAYCKVGRDTSLIDS